MMVSSTLTQYKESYNLNLEQFLNEYEDNTVLFFLQKEKEKYQTYQRALTKISDQMKMFTRDELKRNLIHKSIAVNLKSINPSAYQKIITEQNLTSPPEGILSLNFEKSNTININEKELENHIKSSIVILKFINEQSEKGELNKSQLSENSSNIGIIDYSTNHEKLYKWLEENDKTKFAFLISDDIESKKSYVIDSYFNFEERYLWSHAKVCQFVLEEIPNESIVLDYKNIFENYIIELRRINPIPRIDIKKLLNALNSAFHLLEKFMDNSIQQYNSFLFNDYFTLLFNELDQDIDNKQNYPGLRMQYFNLLEQIFIDYDKGKFENQDAYTNDNFNRDCNEIEYIVTNRLWEFTPDNDATEEPGKLYIMDIIINSKKTAASEEANKKENHIANPYPRIFKDNTAYLLFEKLVEEFGNTKENLSNYSFVYHRMKKDKLIFDDYQKLQFAYFLMDFNISIDRIKRLEEIGKIAYRESIYSNAKSTTQ